MRITLRQLIFSLVTLLLVGYTWAIWYLLDDKVEHVKSSLNQNLESHLAQFTQESLAKGYRIYRQMLEEQNGRLLEVIHEISESETLTRLLWKHQSEALPPFLAPIMHHYQVSFIALQTPQGRPFTVVNRSRELTDSRIQELAHSEPHAAGGEPHLHRIASTGNANAWYWIVYAPVLNAFGDIVAQATVGRRLSLDKALIEQFHALTALDYLQIIAGEVVARRGFPGWREIPKALKNHEQPEFYRIQPDNSQDYCRQTPGLTDGSWICLHTESRQLRKLGTTLHQSAYTLASSIRERILLLSAGILALTLIIAAYLVRLLSAPLKQTIQALERLSQHNDKSFLPISTNANFIQEVSLLRQALERFSHWHRRQLTLQEQIHKNAYYDPVTGLPNRWLLEERLQQLTAQASRNRHPYVVLFLDIDNFKAVNDTLGHLAGDQLLRLVARRLQEKIRASDTLARWGGDEFVILAPGLDTASHCEHLVVKLLETFSAPFIIDETPRPITASCGIASYPRSGTTPEAILSAADNAMYQAKRQTNGGYHFFVSEDNVRLHRRVRIEMDLRSAAENGELQLYYQPIYPTTAEHPLYAEVLLRWEHPDLGWISPAEFIPIAEQSGAIIALDHWVIDQALRQLDRWRREGGPIQQLSINISALQLRSPTFSRELLDLCSMHDIPTNIILLEIVETELVAKIESVLTNIETLHKAGIRLSMDDFGTGYSSLQYFIRLYPDTLKIDKSFIDNITTDIRQQALVDGFIALAHSLDIKVVAEGVETREQYQLLKALGCDAIQGYLLARPMPAEAIQGLSLTGDARQDSEATDS